MQLSDVLLKPTPLNWNDRLLVALQLLGGKRSPYRVPVVDEKFKVAGVISGRRILELLVGRRGEAIRAKVGLKNIFKEPVNLFLDEARNVFPDSTGLSTVLQYMAENTLGYIFIIDQAGVLKGVVNEDSILGELKGKKLGMKVQEAMTTKVHSAAISSTLLDASITMVDRQIRRLPIEEEGKLKGIITVTDILHHILLHSTDLEMIPSDMVVADALTEKVQDVMSKQFSIEPWRDLGEASDKMVENNISGLPVVSEQEELVGIISRIDVITRLVKAMRASKLVEMMGV